MNDLKRLSKQPKPKVTLDEAPGKRIRLAAQTKWRTNANELLAPGEGSASIKT
jgi:hypothetical protein